MRGRHVTGSAAGFTLIELLIVVIIIGILTGVAVPTYLNQRKKAWMTAVTSDLHYASLAEETYANDHAGTYLTGPGTSLAVAGFRVSPNIDVTAVATGTTYTLVGVYRDFPGCSITFQSGTDQLVPQGCGA